MANFTITIDDNLIVAGEEVLAKKLGYIETVQVVDAPESTDEDGVITSATYKEVPNPQSKIDFILDKEGKKMTIQFRETVKAALKRKAEIEINEQVSAIQGEIVITPTV